MTTTTADYRITERCNDTDNLIRVVAMLTEVTYREARVIEMESIPASENHIRLEKWNTDHDVDHCGWEYL